MKNFIKNNLRSIVSFIVFTAMVLTLYISKDGPLTMALILFFAMYFGLSIAIAKIVIKNINVSTVSYETEKNQDKQLIINIENEGILPLLNVRINIEAQNIITRRKDASNLVADIMPKKEKNLHIVIRDNLCGAIRIKIDEVIAGDVLGIVKIKKKLNICEYLYIFPNVEKLAISDKEINKYDMESYKYSPIQKGNDTSETFGISNYQPGDSIKAIHWKLSSKMDNIVIRELGLPIDNKLMILVDKSDVDGESLRSDATGVAASLAYTMILKGVSHHIGWDDENKKEFVTFIIRGQEDFWSMVPELLRSPFVYGIEPIEEQFISADCEKQFTNFAVVSNNEVGIERLMTYGEVNIYRPQQFK